MYTIGHRQPLHYDVDQHKFVWLFYCPTPWPILAAKIDSTFCWLPTDQVDWSPSNTSHYSSKSKNASDHSGQNKRPSSDPWRIPTDLVWCQFPLNFKIMFAFDKIYSKNLNQNGILPVCKTFLLIAQLTPFIPQKKTLLSAMQAHCENPAESGE